MAYSERYINCILKSTVVGIRRFCISRRNEYFLRNVMFSYCSVLFSGIPVPVRKSSSPTTTTGQRPSTGRAVIPGKRPPQPANRYVLHSIKLRFSGFLAQIRAQKYDCFVMWWRIKDCLLYYFVSLYLYPFVTKNKFFLNHFVSFQPNNLSISYLIWSREIFYYKYLFICFYSHIIQSND